MVAPVERCVGNSMSKGRRLCPRCGMHWVVPGTVAAKKYGACEACYYRALADAMESRAAALDAFRRYEAARKHAHGGGRGRVAPEWR